MRLYRCGRADSIVGAADQVRTVHQATGSTVLLVDSDGIFVDREVSDAVIGSPEYSGVLRGRKVRFSRCSFKDVKLRMFDCEFIDCRFERASWYPFAKCKFDKCVVTKGTIHGAEDSKFLGCVFVDGAGFSGKFVKCDLSSAKLYDCVFADGVLFDGCDLSNTVCASVASSLFGYRACKVGDSALTTMLFQVSRVNVWVTKPWIARQLDVGWVSLLKYSRVPDNALTYLGDEVGWRDVPRPSGVKSVLVYRDVSLESGEKVMFYEALFDDLVGQVSQ